MALKTFKPTTASRRHTVLVDRSGLSKKSAHKPLLAKNNKTTGRNNRGVITIRHRGGGVRGQYRMIDFMRTKRDIPAVVETVEYDPNRTAFIALLKYADGERAYILAPDGIEVGQQIQSGAEAPIEVGNATTLARIPQGSFVHAVELWPGQGAKIGRSAGTNIQVMGRNQDYVQLKMPSGEIRLVHHTAYATVGMVSNPDHKNEKLGKAGRSRMRGVRPTVRGVAMSINHPHAGGQGKKGKGIIGGPAQDPWGNRLGKRTRKHRKPTSKFIVSRRPSQHKFKKYKTIV